LPYRRRLTVAVICVILIAVLWGGGLAAILPGTKVLISQEGLHGWAWSAMVRDRFGMRLAERPLVEQAKLMNRRLAFTTVVDSVADKGPAAQAGIRKGWFIRLARTDRQRSPSDTDVLIRNLAKTPTGRQVALEAYDPQTRQLRSVTLTSGRLRWTYSLLLGKIAMAVPEPENRAGRFPLLVGLLIVGLVVTLLRDLLRFVQEYLVETAVWQGMMDLRCDNYTVALHMPVSIHAIKGTSDMMSRFIRDTNELARGQVTLFGKTLVEPAKAIVSVLLALALSWKLTLLAMVAGPPAFIIIRKLGKYMRRASRRALQSWSRVLAVLEETLTGIRVVKAYTMEGEERRRFFRVNRELFEQQKRIAAIDAATAPLAEALGMAAAMCAAGFAGHLVLNDQMDPYSFLTWMGALAAMFDPVRKLAKVATRFQRAESAARRIFELQDSQQEKSPPGAPMLPRHSESIRFEARRRPSRREPDDPGRPDRRDRRTQRVRKDHAGLDDPPPVRPDRRADTHR